MKNIWLFILLFLSFPLMAQHIYVEDFDKVKKVKGQGKQFALLDLETNEKGFTFFIGETPVEVKEDEGYIRLMMPHKSSQLTIKHPQYGQFRWKIPGKGLKKKKHYRAYLRTESIDKEFKLNKQWAVLYIQPHHVIVQIDSVMHAVQNGMLSLYLPIGKHACKIFSPFYQEQSDMLEITDSIKLERQYVLKPYYSYLTVETANPTAQIVLDNQMIGVGEAKTSRIKPGRYRLVIKQQDLVYYDQWVQVENAENKVLRFTANDLHPLPEITTVQSIAHTQLYTDLKSPNDMTGIANDSIQKQAVETQIPKPITQSAFVTIQALDDQTEIWVNRENKGLGKWQGEMAAGFYAVSTRKEGFNSKTSYFWVEAGKELELDLQSPKADYGMLNIASNVINATVYLNGLEVGHTPCVIQDLPAHQDYKVELAYGKNKAKQIVRIKPNDIMHLNIKLKTK